MTRMVSKTSVTIKLIGKLDTILSIIGYSIGHDEKIDRELDDVQELIKIVLNSLSYEKDIDKNIINELENKMKIWEDMVKSIDGFVKPKGRSAILHILRTTIREAEIIAWESDYKNIAIFLNRLSDHVFLMAIYLSNKLGELVYFNN